jgi:translation elongation factor EF-G
LSKSKSRDANAQIDFARLLSAAERVQNISVSACAAFLLHLRPAELFEAYCQSAALNMANQFIIQYEIQGVRIYKNKATIKSDAAHGPAACHLAARRVLFFSASVSECRMCLLEEPRAAGIMQSKGITSHRNLLDK